VPWQTRAHFLAVAARQMRSILIDHARARSAEKRGGGALRITLTDATVATAPRDAELLAVDAALCELAALDPRQGAVVELRFFGGLTVEETAEVLDISPATVKREWRMARAWLYRALTGESQPSP
jgi:RNA polymerase sigma factor (TIGR02999 family)